MPKVRTDWSQLLYDAGQSTTGWACEMHVRSAAGVEPAILKLSTADGTLLVGQATESGATYGIAVDAPAADMDFAPGTYELDLLRTDGGLNTDLFEGEICVLGFILPVTEVGKP